MSKMKLGDAVQTGWVKVIISTILILALPLATANAPEGVEVLPLNALNERFLIRQRELVESQTRRHFGSQLADSTRNITLLQRLIDEERIDRDEKRELQALGVVLGDIFITRHRDLDWRVYEDELGKSMAVCVRDTAHCLFPVTMISRRVAVGLQPKVEQLIDRGMGLIAPHLSKLPFER